MTTAHDHTPFLDQQDDPNIFWEQRIRASRWMITKTFALGAIAVPLAVYGQGWLEHGAPLLPILSQNYGLWQTVYIGALVLFFLLWVAALRQKFGLLENSKLGLAKQQRIDEHNARVEERRQANRVRHDAVRKEREEHTIYFKASGGNASKKFEY